MATPTDTEDTTVRMRALRIRETRQPTVAAAGSTNYQQAQDEPLGAGGLTVDVDRVLAGDQDDEDGVGHVHRERRQRGRAARPQPPHQCAGPQHSGQTSLEEPRVGSAP